MLFRQKGRSDAHGASRQPAETERGLKGTSFRFFRRIFLIESIFSLPSVVAMWYDNTIYCGNYILESFAMDTKERQYRKIAKTKAKEYLRNKKGYKTKAEKKAFKIAEKFRINQWKKSLTTMDEREARARMKAFRVYKARIHLVRRLILAGTALLTAAVLLVGLL